MPRDVRVILGEPFGSFVDEQIREGRFKNASEVMHAGLRLLEDEETKRAALREALLEGEASGPAIPLVVSRIESSESGVIWSD